MTTFNHRENRRLPDVRRREYKGQKFYHPTAEELANPEWVARFKLDNPDTTLMDNKPITIRRGDNA